MDKVFGVNTFIMDSGERYCLVIDRSTGLPVYCPNLYLTTQIRNRSHSVSTLTAAAGNLVVLLRFLDRRGINIEERILTKQFLKPHELDDLRDFAQLKQSELPTSETISWLSTEDLESCTDTVDNGTHYSRLTTFASYIEWYAKHLLGNTDQLTNEVINSIAVQIKERRPQKKNRNGHIKDRSIDDFQLDVLFEVIRLDSDLNPFELEVQKRNRLMILILYHLGIRGGELLNIRIADIDFQTNRLAIVRRADEKSDPRVKQPNAKTKERLLPLADSLVKELHDYIVKHRRVIKNAKTHDYLFITFKNGPTVGQPISKAAYHKIIGIVRFTSPELYRLTGHTLRHTWNRKFSEKMDAMDEQIDEAKQEKIRSYLMGWQEGSGTAAIYNKRFIEQKSHTAALALQETSGTRLPRNLKNDE